MSKAQLAGYAVLQNKRTQCPSAKDRTGAALRHPFFPHTLSYSFINTPPPFFLLLNNMYQMSYLTLFIKSCRCEA